MAVQNFNNVNELIDRVKHFENISHYKSEKTTRNEYQNYRSDNKTNIYRGTGNDNGLKHNCLKCNSSHHSTRFCPKGSVFSYCKEPGHYEVNCPKKKNDVRRIEINGECEYIKTVLVNDVPLKAFIDLGSDCVTILESAATELNLNIHDHNKTLKGFGNNFVKSLGITEIKLEIDNIFYVNAFIVDDSCQNDPVMIGRSALDRKDILVLKCFKSLQIFEVPQSDYIIKHNLSDNTFKIDELDVKLDKDYSNEKFCEDVLTN